MLLTKTHSEYTCKFEWLSVEADAVTASSSRASQGPYNQLNHDCVCYTLHAKISLWSFNISFWQLWYQVN